MEKFPTKFSAQKIQSDIVHNRRKKIERDLKLVRKKIVQSFQGSVTYHSEVIHEMLPDLSEEEQKSFYCSIKDELKQRGFTVRGKIENKQLSLIIFSNIPRTNEMDKVLRHYSEDGSASGTSTPRSDRSDSVSPTSQRKRLFPPAKDKKMKKVTRSSSIPTHSILPATSLAAGHERKETSLSLPAHVSTASSTPDSSPRAFVDDMAQSDSPLVLIPDSSPSRPRPCTSPPPLSPPPLLSPSVSQPFSSPHNSQPFSSSHISQPFSSSHPTSPRLDRPVSLSPPSSTQEINMQFILEKLKRAQYNKKA